MARKFQGKRFDLPEELTKSIITTKFRCSYEHIIEPWSGDPDKPARYSVQMIFPKNDQFIKKSKDKVKKIAVEAFGPNAVKLMRSGKLHNPFRNGDDEFPEDEVYQGNVFVNANGAFEGKKPPGVIDQAKNNIRLMNNPEDIIYSGCYARAEIKFYPYDREGGKGVACYLFNVQKLADGEPLAGGRRAEDIFDEVEVEEDEAFDVEDDF